ncbi:MAG: restriction endonuclease subunit S [Candidatus Cryptobacteroides sp.]
MARYEKYKDSGQFWLGEVPSHWDFLKMKYVFSERSQKGHPNEPLLSATQNHGVIPQDLYENRVVSATKGLESLKLVEVGDFVISLRSFQGGIEYAYYRGIISPAYTILTPQKIEASYFKHLGKSGIFIDLLKSTVTGIREGQNIDYGKLRDYYLPIPPVEEQKAMAAYLDSVTAEIDKAIDQQQRMIDLLNERKQIIIQNAVTKGLDPNVPMKDSGVDYIGQIPASWELKKIKYLASYNDEALPETTKKDTEIDYVEIGDVSFGQGITNSTKYLFGDAPSRARRITQKGDIIISTVRTYLKVVAVIDKDDLIVSTGFMVIRPNTRMIDGQFMSYAVLASSLINEIEKISVGTSYPAVNAWQVADLKIAYPNSKDEQERIADYLFKVESYVGIAINRHKMAIAVLQERKRIIINDVVTGKIKVL